MLKLLGQGEVKSFKEVYNSGLDNKEKMTKILKLIDDLGIEPSQNQEPLPMIEKDDIHLISWMVISDE